MNAALVAAWMTRLDAAGAVWSGSFWRACWQGGVFIGLAWAVCRAVPTLSPRVRHGLWLLACLKLAVGLAWAAPLALPVRSDALPFAFAAPVVSAPSHPPLLRGTGRDIGNVPNAPLASAAPRPALSWRMILFGLWVGGVGAGLGRMARQAFALKHLCRNARPLDDTTMGEWARALGIGLGLAHPPRVAECDAIAAPLVAGPLCPLILLPPGFAARFSPDESRLALAHELAHVRGGDLWLALIPAVAQILFFPFPPVWFACREWTTARESLRDQDALRLTNAPAAVYGGLLLKLAAQDNKPRTNTLHGAIGATANYHTLHSRLLWMKRQAQDSRPVPRWRRPVLALLALPLLALLTPWRIQARGAATPAIVPAAPPAGSAAEAADPARIAALDLRANGDPRKRYLLIGTGADAPPGGYHLLVALPGGGGGPDFQSFVKRIQAYGLPPGYLVAELVAPQWTPTQARTLVWPTRANTLPGVGFPTEAFVEDTIRDVQARYALNARYVFTLGWASGGPACYAAGLQPVTQTRGAFIAMSVFLPATLPPLNPARDRRFFLQQPLDANLAPLDMATAARAQLRAQGANVKLVTYEGGYGWHRGVYAQIRRGIDWLEQK